MAREIEARAAAEAERRLQREAVLRLLMADLDKRWAAVDALAARGSASGYEQAVRALTDLAEGYALASSRAGRALSASRVRLLSRVSGGFLIGGGAWLAFSRR